MTTGGESLGERKVLSTRAYGNDGDTRLIVITVEKQPTTTVPHLLKLYNDEYEAFLKDRPTAWTAVIEDGVNDKQIMRAVAIASDKMVRAKFPPEMIQRQLEALGGGTTDIKQLLDEYLKRRLEDIGE